MAQLPCQATSFPDLLHRLATTDWAAYNLLTTNSCYRQPQRAGHEPVCLVPEWTSICLCLSGVFAQASPHILRASCSSDIGIPTDMTSDSALHAVVLTLVAGRQHCQPRPHSQRQQLHSCITSFRLRHFSSEMHFNAFQCIAQPNTTLA